jgi:hypothetical protein
MGMSASAAVVYGIKFYDGEDFTGDPVPWADPDGGGDFEEWLSKISGIKEPLGEYPKGYDKSKWSESEKAIAAEYASYWEQVREWKDINCQLEVTFAGHTDFSYHLLTLKGWGANVDWEPEVIDPDKLVPADAEKERYLSNLARLGLSNLGEPKVYLIAKYG